MNVDSAAVRALVALSSFAALATAAIGAGATPPPSAVALGASTPRPAPAAVPAANFLVEWRVQAGSAPPQPGALVIGTAAPPPAGWTTVRSGDAAPADAAPVGMRVANGREALLRLDATQARRDYDFIWTAQGQGVVSRDAVVHDVRSLRVTPHWPGGAAPVTLALAVAQSRAAAGAEAAGPGAAGQALELQSTVELHFDEWFTVARLGGAGDLFQVRVTRR